MEDILVDQYLWVAIFGTKHVGIKYEVWMVLERNTRSIIKECFIDLTLLNTSKEKIVTTLKTKLGICITINPC
jgi:hypothetical protein